MATSIVRVDEKKYTSNAEALAAAVTDIVVKDGAKCLEAKRVKKTIADELKQRHFVLDPFVVQAKANYDEAKDQRAKWITPLETLEEKIEQKIKTYEREERERTQREQDAINAENARLKREADEQERKDKEAAAKIEREAKVKEIRALLKAGKIGKRESARLLKEAGAHEEAALAQAAADAETAKATPPPPVTLKPDIPAVAGVPSRVNYKAEVLRPELLINAYVDAVHLKNTERAVYLRQFIMVNAQKLGEEARTVKNSKHLASQIPGVRFYED
jgi:hypothetical protein